MHIYLLKKKNTHPVKVSTHPGPGGPSWVSQNAMYQSQPTPMGDRLSIAWAHKARALADTQPSLPDLSPRTVECKQDIWDPCLDSVLSGRGLSCLDVGIVSGCDSFSMPFVWHQLSPRYHPSTTSMDLGFLCLSRASQQLPLPHGETHGTWGTKSFETEKYPCGQQGNRHVWKQGLFFFSLCLFGIVLSFFSFIIFVFFLDFWREVVL